VLYKQKNYMPQLDFFIYPAIIIQSIFGIFILFYLLMEPILTIFKSLKTRKLLMEIISEEISQKNEHLVAGESIKEATTSIKEYITQTKNV
jgi:hypothetical protein